MEKKKTISKTGAETVRCRTGGLSAYGGQHFTGTSGSLTFAAAVWGALRECDWTDLTSKEVTR